MTQSPRDLTTSCKTLSVQGLCTDPVCWLQLRRSTPLSLKSSPAGSIYLLPSVHESPASWHTERSRWGWEKSLLEHSDSLRCSSLCVLMASPMIQLVNFCSLQMAQQSLDASKMAMSLHISGREAEQLLLLCSQHKLEPNDFKIGEVIVDFRRHCSQLQYPSVGI